MAERKRAIITGASSGVGRAAALRFAAEGWDVCLTARRQTSWPASRRSWRRAITWCARATTASRDRRGHRRCRAERWGGLDALINCAGIYFPVHSIDTPMASWRPAFDIMVDGALTSPAWPCRS